MLCSAYKTGYSVEKQRLSYIEEQMNNSSKEIVVPSSVNFTDCSVTIGFDTLYYYNKPGDIAFRYIPYEEWINNYYIKD